MSASRNKSEAVRVARLKDISLIKACVQKNAPLYIVLAVAIYFRLHF